MNLKTCARQSAETKLLIAAVVLTACAPLASHAQERLRQATIIVGSPAGGATDKLARMYADALKQRYATTVIVENRPGAGGILAYEYVKNSPQKDGSLTFLSPAYPLTISPHVVRNLPYDTLKDFVPVAVAARSTMTYVIGSAVPASIRTLEAYLQWCRDNPKQALYAAQTGSSQHLLGSLLALSSKIKLENVSYKGDAPAMQDLLGGHIPAVVLPIASAIPLYKAGQIRVLAVSAAKPSRYLPDVPTFQELDHKDILFQDWLGVFAPAGTSPEAVRQMNMAMGDAARSEAGQAALTNLGFTPEIVTPEVFAEMVRADHRRYGVLVERTRFREVFEKSSGQ
jgi:tripartite-type tricarboxylate transporter receptor subunit TctC